MSTRLLFVVAVVLALIAGAAVGVALTPPQAPRTARDVSRGPVQQPPLASALVVTSPYGRRGLGWHTGVDLRARTGTPLAAVGPGVVERTRTTRKGGLTVVVKLDDGWRTGYAHLSRIDVTEGERVAPGARVGLAGSTGHSSGPHLHFEMRDPRTRSLVDPWPHLSGHAPARSSTFAFATGRAESAAAQALYASRRTARALSRVDVSAIGGRVEREAWRGVRLVRRTIARAV